MLFLIKKNVSFLKDCSIEFSLFDNDKYSAIIKFSELNFVKLMEKAGLSTEGKLLFKVKEDKRIHLALNSDINGFFNDNLQENFYDIVTGVFHFIDWSEINPKQSFLEQSIELVAREISELENGF